MQREAPMADDEIEELAHALAALPAPLEPLDVMALDGFLCGVILQPQAIPEAQWLARVVDVDGRTPAPSVTLDGVHRGARRRHAELQTAIDGRMWFDPWIFPLEDDASPSQTVLPWVAGFAMALDLFPALIGRDEPALVEPLALLYLHFDPADLEEADELLEVIETLEPPPDLAEAVQDLVRALMLIADVTRPRQALNGGRDRAHPARSRRR